MRTEEYYKKFHSQVESMREKLDVNHSVLPRRRRPSKRKDDNQDTAHSHTNTYDLYRQAFFQALDTIKTCIEDRFNQKGMSAHIALEQLLLKTSAEESVEEELNTIIKFNNSDFNWLSLEHELELLSLSDSKFNVISEFFAWIAKGQNNSVYPQLSNIAKLLLLMPASNAATEMSFSAMKRLKSDIRSSMSQVRLNSLMLLHVHNDLTDTIDIQEVIRLFAAYHPRREKNL
ncbi:zinc finger MYM-type protein 1-like [Watersipora subatra]|uniref:zinc finger MYM-type protein 1-like n=1 Tax=Watersipora subatra TaxID=2589382 RepID=UPI00355BD3BE